MIDARIRVSENHDKLVFSAAPKDITTLKGLLMSKNPDLSFNRSAEGVSIASNQVTSLDLGIPGVHFKWSELSKRFVKNRMAVSSTFPNFLSKVNSIKNEGADSARKVLGNRKSLNGLDPHQVVNVACMTLKEGFGLCVFDEQGAGKTVTMIHAFDVLVDNDEIDFALIIAPKSMVSEWPKDFEKFTHGVYKVETLIGTQKEKNQALARKADIIVTNFETTVSMEQELTALLRSYGDRSIIVVDESFYAKNLEAGRTRSIRRLREYCKRGFVLCGTPAPNSPIDLVQQFNIVDLGCAFDGIVIPKERDIAIEVVSSVIEERGLFVRNLKVDVLPELPQKSFHKVIIPLQPEQAKLYKGLRDSLVSDLERVDSVDFEKQRMSFLARRSALLQICSNPASVSDTYNEVPAKLLAIDDILEDLIGKRGEKVILWSFYTAMIDLLYSRYKRFNPVRYDGTVNDIKERREAVRLFKETDLASLFIGNPAAAGAGLNLQSAKFAVYESMSNQAAHYLQSLDRIHRRGQENQVEYIILLCEDTLECQEYDRLLEKERTAQSILGDPSSTTLTREIMLSELLDHPLD